MRQLLYYTLLFSWLISSCGQSEKLFPKRYLGNYEGIQETYEVEVKGESIEVPSAKYELALSYGTLHLITPRQKMRGEYIVSADTKMYYSLRVKLETGVIEEWQLWKKGKRLVRKPSSPQPELVFIPVE